MSQEINSSSVYSVYFIVSGEMIQLPTSCITELYFVESIFCTNMFGKITFVDFQRIFADKTFSGTELIYITYGTEQTYTKCFTIHEFKKYSSFQTQSRNGDGVFELVLCDMFYSKYTHKQISYSWMGKRNDEILKDMFLMFNSEEEIGTWEQMVEDESVMLDDGSKATTAGNSSEYVYYSPYFTFKENLKYILSRSSSTCADSMDRSGLLFYPYTEFVNDNIQVKYNLVNLFTLLNNRELMKTSADDGTFSVGTTEPLDFRKVIDWNIKFYNSEDLKILRRTENYWALTLLQKNQ